MKSDAVKMEEKMERIKTAKNLLMEKIAYAQTNIELNTGKISQNLEEHNEFIHFTELMKVYELYKWKTLKFNYTNIKKKTNLDKKIYKQIIKIYSEVVSYLPDVEAGLLGKNIRQIQADNDLSLIHI
jgi:hypothetical protein